MNKRRQLRNLNRFWLFSISTFLLIAATQSMAQQIKGAPSIFGKTPKISQINDEVVCGGNATAGFGLSKYCALYRKYKIDHGVDEVGAKDDRDQMLDLIKLDLDANFKAITDGRVNKTRWYETLFDLLGITAAFGGEIIHGERVKAIIAGASGAAQTGRNTINKDFRLLENAAFVNQMKADRINQWTEVIKNKTKNTSEYGWDLAKGDLLQYYICGTFNNAMNSVVEKTGNNIATANANQANVVVLGAVTKRGLTIVLDNFKTYINPMYQKAKKLDADIDAKNKEIDADEHTLEGLAPGTPLPAVLLVPLTAPILAKIADVAGLEKQKAKLMESYKNLWQAIEVSGDFDAIDQKVRAKYGAAIQPRYDNFLAAFKADTPITALEYFFVLGKVNGIMADNPDLNKNFAAILKMFTP